MTQDEIIRMARESGLGWVAHKRLERFAALVSAHEREACAKVCEEMIASVITKPMPLKDIVAAIRARGEK